MALRSLLWLRIGVVAVRDTYVAISKQMVSIAPRMTSAVTGIDGRGVGQPAPASRELHQIDVHRIPHIEPTGRTATTDLFLRT